jgi:hypothetical protein
MHTRVTILAACIGIGLLAAPWVQAQGQKGKTGQKARGKEKVEAPAVAAEAEAAPIASEGTFEACQDGQDNDGDTHVDCEDQDCEIYAICVPEPPPEYEPEPVFLEGPVTQTVVVHHRPLVERGGLCSDGLDNDSDGLVDCFDKDCHRTWYCRRQIYYVPEPSDKAPGFMFSIGGGLALPNFRGESEPVDSTFHGEVQFYPDLGLMAQLKFGYLPLRWMGLGVNINGGVSAASNREETEDSDLSFRYKYEAAKAFAFAGVFVRFQYPGERFVPYIDIGGGYSYARQRWWIYDGQEDWEDIDEEDSRYLDGLEEVETRTFRHFTLALEPGFDVFVRKRSVAVGLRAWLPVWATANPSTDNIGVMLNVTVTPMWRERPRLRPEYENPAATFEEETGEAPELEAAVPETVPDQPPEAAADAPFEGRWEKAETGPVEESTSEATGAEAAPSDAVAEDPYAEPKEDAKPARKNRKSKKDKKDKKASE